MAGQQNAREMRVAPRGDLRAAPLGSPLPALPTDAWGAEWDVLGIADDGGVEVTPEKNTDSIGVWQSRAPGLYYLESAGLTVAYNLVQRNQITTRHYFGAEWEVTPGVQGRLRISSNPPIDEMMLAVTWFDQLGHVSHLVLERGAVTDRENITLNATTGEMYGVTFSAMPLLGDTEDLAILITNDPAVVGLAESS